MDQTTGPVDVAAQSVDYDALGKNIALLMQEGGKALAAYLKPYEDGKPRPDAALEWTDITKTLGRVAEYWLTDPNRAELMARFKSA